MIEKIDKTLHLKVELNTKDDCNIIGIEYYLHDTELQKKALISTKLQNNI